MPHATFGETLTYWREWGGGPRRAVMAHCSLAHSGAWAGVAERLKDRLYLQAFDMPGHGRSGPWELKRDYMDQTFEMAEGLVGGEQVDLIGHSFGAVACLRFAVEQPDLVRSLVLFEPVFFAAAKADGVETEAMFAPFAKAMDAGDNEAATREFSAIWGGGEPWEALPDAQRSYMTERIHLIPASAPAIHEDRAGLLAEGRLEAVTAPVLLLAGETAPPVIDAINTALSARLPNAQRQTIAGAGHMGPLSHPAAIADAIARFLSL